MPDEYKPFVPPAGSFLLGVMGTWVIVGGRVKRERTKKQQLQKQNQILIKERDDLAALNSSLEKMGRGPSGDEMIRGGAARCRHAAPGRHAPPPPEPSRSAHVQMPCTARRSPSSPRRHPSLPR